MIHFADKHNPQIYTTGAFLHSIQVKDANGNDIWIWAVEKFEDDSYNNGEVCNPLEVATTLEQLKIETML
ncbi:MAG: hypothetical protein LBB41_02080 [Prevotellaceae bacterium]|jgi:hypothetical protein|nr:hypothetical protein [Prevotellaceae bacterium]